MLQEMMTVVEVKGQVRNHQWCGKFATLAFMKIETKKRNFFSNIRNAVTPK